MAGKEASSFDNNVHITLMHVSSITVQTLLYRTHCFQVLIKWAFHMFKKVFDTVSVQKPHSQSWVLWPVHGNPSRLSLWPCVGFTDPKWGSGCIIPAEINQKLIEHWLSAQLNEWIANCLWLSGKVIISRDHTRYTGYVWTLNTSFTWVFHLVLCDFKVL